MLPNRVFSSPNMSSRSCASMFYRCCNCYRIFYSYRNYLSFSTEYVFFIVFDIGGMAIFELAIGSSSTNCLIAP